MAGWSAQAVHASDIRKRSLQEMHQVRAAQ